MNRSERFRDLAALLLLGAAIAFFFWKLLLTNLILARGDTLLYIYPYWEAAGRAIRAGRLPLWNPDLFMGAPFLANSQAGVLYPVNWLLWILLDTPNAVSVSIFVHLWLAAGLTYGFARSGLQLNRLPAWFSAVLYGLGGYLTAQVEHVNQIQGLAWLPAVFWLLASGASRRRPLLLGLVLGIQVLAGHTQAVFITVVGGAVYALGQLWRAGGTSARARTDLTHLILGGAVASLVAAAQILPTLELAQYSLRGGGLPIDEALSFSLHPLIAGRSLLPGYGETIFSEYVAFLPLSALLLAMVGAYIGRRRPAIIGLGLVGAVGLFFAVGAANPAYVLLARFVPGFDLFRAPARWLILYAFGAAGLAGVGFNALLTRRSLPRLKLLSVWLTVMLLLIGWNLAAPCLATYLAVAPEAPVATPSTATLIGWAAELMLAPLLLFAKRTSLASLLVIPGLFLSSRALPYNHPTAPESFHALRPAPAQLMAAAALDRADGSAPAPRFLSMSDIFFDPGDMGELESIYGDQLTPDALYNLVVAGKHKEVLSPNLPLVFEVPAVDGYDGGVLPLSNYVALERVLLPEESVSLDGRLRENLDALPDGRWLNLFNVRYLITDKVGDAWSNGVYYDLQHSAALSGGNPRFQLTSVPQFEATGLGVVLDRQQVPPETLLLDVTVRFLDGRVESMPIRNGVAASPLRTDADGNVLEVTLLRWSKAGTPKAITLEVGDQTQELRLRGLSLVDERDGTFQSIVISSKGSYELVHSGDVKIYENLDALPRAFLVGRAAWAEGNDATLERMLSSDFDPATEVVLTGGGISTGEKSAEAPGGQIGFELYEPERVALAVSADSDAWLVLTDAYYPGWEAEVDGRAVPIERADLLFRAIRIQSGRHQVVFSFRPLSVRFGLLISVASAALFLLLLALTTVRKLSQG